MTINESIYVALSVSEASKVSPLLIGNPGAGKTTSVEFYAKANNMEMVLLRGSQSSPEEILGYEVNDGLENVRGNVKVKVASKLCPKWYDKLLENHENGVRTLLFLDEITTASSFVQAALLQVIFGREIDNGYKIPDDTFIVAAGNYAGNLSADFNLIPPLMNRFCIFNVSINIDDMKAFASRYSDRQDIVSRLISFDRSNSNDLESIDKSFIKLVKRSMESKICEYVQTLMSQGKFDPNITEMSDIYSDQSTGTKLLGFLTPRTMGYYINTSIFMYLKYGLDGINSDTFREMTAGLVGISLKADNRSSSKVSKEILTDEFIKVVSSMASQLDKKRINSISTAEEQVKRIISKLNSNGDRVNLDVLSSPDLISLKKIFDSCINDREMRKVQSPIDPKIILECSELIVSSARNVLVEDSNSIKDLVIKKRSNQEVDTSSINLDRINGSIKNYNDSIKAYKSISQFISIPEFNYSSDVVSRIKSEDYNILQKNKFRVDSLKNNLRAVANIPMSDLVETENL